MGAKTVTGTKPTLILVRSPAGEELASVVTVPAGSAAGFAWARKRLAMPQATNPERGRWRTGEHRRAGYCQQEGECGNDPEVGA